jgi:aminoglycoside phosphotransferase (APT) family kinase protein
MPGGKFATILARVEPGGRLHRVWTLGGGLSAQMVALEAECADGALRRLIVRRAIGAAEQRTSLSIEDEYRLLAELQEVGLPAPNPRLFDGSRSILDQPYSVLDFIDGSRRFSTGDPVSTGRAFASQLAAIHAVDRSRRIFAHLSRRSAEIERRLATRPDVVDEALCEGLIREVLRANWPPAEPDQVCLLHGDFWPGNVLWQDGEIVGVIDWEDASLGDPLADVGITRLELLWAFGRQAMTSFTEHHLTITSCSPALPASRCGISSRPSDPPAPCRAGQKAGRASGGPT